MCMAVSGRVTRLHTLSDKAGPRADFRPRFAPFAFFFFFFIVSSLFSSLGVYRHARRLLIACIDCDWFGQSFMRLLQLSLFLYTDNVLRHKDLHRVLDMREHTRSTILTQSHIIRTRVSDRTRAHTTSPKPFELFSLYLYIFTCVPLGISQSINWRPYFVYVPYWPAQSYY